MQKLIYLTGNKDKAKEARKHFIERHGLDMDIKDPDFEVIEIQAESSIEVAKYSAKYAAERLNQPVLKSDTALYIDYLGGLPGPYNKYFYKQIGIEKLLYIMKDVEERSARLEHSFAFCCPGEDPVIFTGGSRGSIAHQSKGRIGCWHDMFYIPDGETKTLSELRKEDELYEAQFWGTAIDDFVLWYKEKYL